MNSVSFPSQIHQGRGESNRFRSRSSQSLGQAPKIHQGQVLAIGVCILVADTVKADQTSLWVQGRWKGMVSLQVSNQQVLRVVLAHSRTSRGSQVASISSQPFQWIRNWCFLRQIQSLRTFSTSHSSCPEASMVSGSLEAGSRSPGKALRFGLR